MNELLTQFAQEADYNFPKFAQLVVQHIVDKIESEAEIAQAQHQAWTQSVLLSLSLEILDEFDMEIPEDEDG